MLRNLLITLSLLVCTNASVQAQLIIEGPDSLMHEGLLLESISAYRDSLVKTPAHPFYNYNMACAFSISGQLDSSIKYLKRAWTADPRSFYSVLTDPDLIAVREHGEWTNIEERAITSLEEKTKKPIKDREYARTLWKLRALDQAYYSDLRLLERKLGKSSTVSRSIWKLKTVINNWNQTELEALIQLKGWPTISQVGTSAAGAAFLIIQHADLALQKKYIPTIEGLCKRQEAEWESYALMYDRIQVDEQKPQKFGSQVKYNSESKKYELFPLLNEAKVDEWRKEMGLKPLADYVAKWDIKLKGGGK